MNPHKPPLPGSTAVEQPPIARRFSRRLKPRENRAMERRNFLLGALLAEAPNGRITLGVIGTGGRGTFVMGLFQKDPTVRVAAVCDVYEPNLERAPGAASKAQDSAPAAYRDYRRPLENKSIDAVLIATPEQGVELVEAEKRTKQIIQVGMQRRSYDLYLEAREIVAAGAPGNVRMVRSWWLNNYLGGTKATKLEGKLDWEQWLGPAGRRPFGPDIFRNWRNYSEFAGGIVADQGAHVYDGIHMLMNAAAPAAVTAAAGRPHREGFDTPGSGGVTGEYAAEFIGVFTINYAAMRYKSRNGQMNHLDGDKARMDIGRGDCRVAMQDAEEAPAIEKESRYGFGRATDVHVQNFLECVRTRKRPTAPMELGFRAALVVQMANLSLKSGRRIEWDGRSARA
jgi:predicted dehydrogenase